MAQRNLKLYLEDILDAILAIESYMNNVSERQFELNIEKQDAVIRRLEIIGEAAKKIPEDVRNSNSSIPWRQMAGMRDILIHEYYGVSVGMIWKVATSDIPKLKLEIEQMIKDFT